MKCSPRTDSEIFSSSKEQACVNTGQDKVLIYPRGWRTRISLKWLLFQEWLTVRRKRSQLRHNISRGVICEGVTAPGAGIINSKCVCFSWGFLYDNCNINQHQSMWSNDSLFLFSNSEESGFEKGSQRKWRSRARAVYCREWVFVLPPQHNNTTFIHKSLHTFAETIKWIFSFNAKCFLFLFFLYPSVLGASL